MATIEEMIIQLQHEISILQDRDRDHDHRITLLLGQLLKIVPELNGMRTETSERFDTITDRLQTFRAETGEHLNRLDTRLDDIVGQLAVIAAKLDKG
jgi:predicted  nucleic acid-binding Zn-ribbon protein